MDWQEVPGGWSAPVEALKHGESLVKVVDPEDGQQNFVVRLPDYPQIAVPFMLFHPQVATIRGISQVVAWHYVYEGKLYSITTDTGRF